MKQLAVIVVMMLSVASCREPGDVHFDEALRLHAQLIIKGEPPVSPKFDAVLAELAKVPKGTKHFTAADSLRLAIERVRAPVRRPLAVAHRDDSALPPEVAAQARACAQLAQTAGRDGGVNARALKALDACRRQVDALDEAAAHRSEPNTQ